MNVFEHVLKIVSGTSGKYKLYVVLVLKLVYLIVCSCAPSLQQIYLIIENRAAGVKCDN